MHPEGARVDLPLYHHNTPNTKPTIYVQYSCVNVCGDEKCVWVRAGDAGINYSSVMV